MCEHVLGALPCDNPEAHEGGGRGCTHTSSQGSHVDDKHTDGGHG